MKNINFNTINEKIFSAGVVHFCGIGGIGMSAIADVMMRNGIKVQGTDTGDRKSYTVQNLLKMGVRVFSEHKKTNISEEISCIVYSTAVNCETNEEIVEARRRNIPVIHRSVALGYVMKKYRGIVISGTHGKTTTTSLIGVVLDKIGLDPVIVSGGIMNQYDANSRMGSGEYIVVEGDESDKSCLNLSPYYSVITNVEKDHADHYDSIEEIEEVFASLIEKSEVLIACNDDLRLRKMLEKHRPRQKCITYGASPDSDFILDKESINFTNDYWNFDIIHAGERYKISTKLSGLHNFTNIAGGFAVCFDIQANGEQIANGIRHFTGVKRRFTHVGKFKNNLVIDDYAHHPTEIIATLQSLREFMEVSGRKNGKVICIFQPHRYSRVLDLFTDFTKAFSFADRLILTHIYAAGEVNSNNVLIEDLALGVQKYEQNLRDCALEISIFELEDIARNLKLFALQSEDVIIFMGAGNISKYAYLLCDILY